MNWALGNGFQLGFRQHSSGVSPEVMKMLRSIVYSSSPMQIYEQGFLEALGYSLGVPLHQKRLKTIAVRKFGQLEGKKGNEKTYMEIKNQEKSLYV